MTTELLSLDDLPSSLIPAARMLVAVPNPNGLPLKYKAALNPGTAPSTLPIATTLQLGGIKGDGRTLAIDPAGIASVVPTAGSDTTAARLVDPRFRGIQRIDLKAMYGARCDGTSHPLGGVFSSLAAATAAYPNIGLTGANWAATEIDTAAFLQAEYDIRTGSAGAGIIGLHEGAQMMVSQQLNIQDGSRVWFHGGRRVTLLTATAVTKGLVPLCVANCPNVGPVLSDLQVLAQATGVGASSSGGGAAWTGFTSGARFLQLDNVQGIDIERVGWNGFDEPILWGDNVYGVSFKSSGGGGNNIGLNWDQTTGLNSMERIVFENGSLSNNNYGFSWDATYGPDSDGRNQNAQGGSVFIKDSSIDYNVVLQGLYLGAKAGSSYAGSSMHITGCHLETTGACSGSARSRIVSRGALFLSENEIYENDGNVPTGYVEVADYTACSMVNNRVNNATMALMYSSSGYPKRATAHGNVLINMLGPVIALTDANGVCLQPGLPTPVGVLNSGAAVAMNFPSIGGNGSYLVTLTANCTFSLTGGVVGQLQKITLVVRGGVGGFTAALPAGVKWPGGVVPTVDTSAGSYNEFYFRTIDGGATYSGSY